MQADLDHSGHGLLHATLIYGSLLTVATMVLISLHDKSKEENAEMMEGMDEMNGQNAQELGLYDDQGATTKSFTPELE